MVENPTDLFNNKLNTTEEFNIIYQGPSFENRIEINDLRKQLKSTEFLIRDLFDELYKEKQTPSDSKSLKIYLKVKKGSFQEIITVVLTSPIVEGIVIGCVIGLFNHILKKKETLKDNIKIEKMTNNFYFVKNVNQIINPLKQEGDKIIISSVSDPNVYTEAEFREKDYAKEYLKELDRQSIYETYEEEFFGYLSRVDINKDTFGFTLEGGKESLSVEFESHLNLQEIKDILGERVWVKTRARYKNAVLYKLEIKEFAIKRRKNLNDYFGG